MFVSLYTMCFLLLQEQTILFMVRSCNSSSSKTKVIVSHLTSWMFFLNTFLSGLCLNIRKWWPRSSQPARPWKSSKHSGSLPWSGQGSVNWKHNIDLSKLGAVSLGEDGKSEKKTEISYRCLIFNRVTAVCITFIFLSWKTGVTHSSLISPELLNRLRPASLSRHFYGKISIFPIIIDHFTAVRNLTWREIHCLTQLTKVKSPGNKPCQLRRRIIAKVFRFDLSCIICHS